MSCFNSRPELEHRCQDLVHIFSECFERSHNTILVAGAEEPLYQVADLECSKNRIHFTLDYYASGLHEIAHWLVAGEERRRLEDYGYWYAPDGRSAEQQAEFEKVEARPQALECILSRAAAFPFRVSADNAEAGLLPSEEFCQAIFCQLQCYCAGALNERSQKLIEALSRFYGTEGADQIANYRREDVR